MSQRQGLLLPLAQTHPEPRTTTSINDGTQYTRIGRFEILERVPHDTRAFTQGLVLIADTTSSSDNAGSEPKIQTYMYEGTGMYGSSQLRRVDTQTGEMLGLHQLDESYFGEGIAHYRDKHNRLHIIQLTWKRRRAFEYIFNAGQTAAKTPTSPNVDDLMADRITSWRYQTTTKEGWGITYSPEKHLLYVSDGSEYIHSWDAETKKEIRKIAVKYKLVENNEFDSSKTITMLNELEYDPATKTILANVWREDILLRIDPETGFVTNMYDLQNLLPRQDRTWRTDVLNGIALTYDPSIVSQLEGYDENTHHSFRGRDEVWVTGKYWPYMFRIRLVDNS
jgi:glutamine cyclotransferase